jgi:sRNA-binding regulator protein Hfq
LLAELLLLIFKQVFWVNPIFLEGQMKTRLTIISLSLLLLFGPLARAASAQQPSADLEKTMKVKSDVASRVTSKKTRVKIKLRNGEELKGRITQADGNRFAITDEKTGKQTDLAYNEVATLKGRGGLSMGWKIAIISIVAVLVVGAVMAWKIKHIELDGPLGPLGPIFR